ncbi:MAG: undecaprenyldiphospho-muramoylpentapeptide beta-N-acetylglucosaminyltransferase [Oscillospiraceae bacterium]
MKILFACGGTGGHINPAISVANYIKERNPDVNILFVGNPRGMEARLVPQAKFKFETVDIMGFERKICFRNFKHNLKAAKCLLTCNKRAKEIITKFNPDVVVGTGGYVSGPILLTANKLGYKTVAHEQNAYPGVSNKLNFKFADKILLAVEDAKKYLPDGKDYIVTGNPVREEIIMANRQMAKEKLKIGNRKCILTFGGSLGANKINEAVADIMQWHQKREDVYHIHATGKRGFDDFYELLKARNVDPEKINHIEIREYIDDMADCLAAADLVISRSGALSLSEIQAAGKASILIPSPNVAENHQYHNAKVMADKNAAYLIEEKNLNKETICEAIEKLILDDKLRNGIAKNAAEMAYLDANKRISDNILDLIKK